MSANYNTKNYAVISRFFGNLLTNVDLLSVFTHNFLLISNTETYTFLFNLKYIMLTRNESPPICTYINIQLTTASR